MVYTDQSTVKVDDTLLPGLFKSIEVVGGTIVDEQEVEGQTKKPKQASGFEDVKINLELVLLESENQSIGDKLEVIQNQFRAPGQEKPQVHRIINEHTAARGVSEVIFKTLTTKTDNKRDQMTVTIELWEYTVMEVTATEYKSGYSADTGEGSGSTTASNLNANYQEYLENARGASPALDTANAARLIETVLDMPY